MRKIQLIITLLTDFGYSDPYVGSMKGVILEINPDATIVDISHDVVPQNIHEAAFILNRAYPFFPKGTIHVVVVDPGVGSSRSIIGVKTDSYVFLAPDNGVLKYVFENHSAVVHQITNRNYFRKKVSQTFQGRDIFAPVAAHLSIGVPLDTLGQSFENYTKGTVPKPVAGDKKISGEIIHIDRFGNGITNIDRNQLTSLNQIRIRVKTIMIRGLSTNYADVPTGKPLALIGSGDTLEISVHQGNASQQLGFGMGDKITISFT